jgi:hypothetical protein
MFSHKDHSSGFYAFVASRKLCSGYDVSTITDLIVSFAGKNGQMSEAKPHCNYLLPRNVKKAQGERHDAR